MEIGKKTHYAEKCFDVIEKFDIIALTTLYIINYNNRLASLSILINNESYQGAWTS